MKPQEQNPYASPASVIRDSSAMESETKYAEETDLQRRLKIVGLVLLIAYCCAIVSAVLF